MRVPHFLGAVVLALLLATGVVSTERPHAAAAAPATSAAGAPVTTDSAVLPQRMIPRPAPDPVSTVVWVATPVVSNRPAPAPAPAQPALVLGSTQQALINRDRAANGLGPLTWSACLARVAASNAARMAAQGYISHTNGPSLDLACGLESRAGENVGYWSGGVDDSQLNTMFMNSPDHRANILGPYRYVATAWAVAANGYGYIAVEFS